jgi:hypothetical protein
MVFLLWIALCVVIAVVASGRGRSGLGFFFLSFFLSPLVGFIVLMVSKPNQQVLEQRALAGGELRKCPACAELVKTEALICRYCGRELPRVQTVLDRATTIQPDDAANAGAYPRDRAPRSHAGLDLAIVVVVLAIAAVVVWLSLAPGSSVPSASPTAARTGVVVPTEIPKVLTVAIDRYGAPDQDYSAEDEYPRPPMVTRLLTYGTEHVRLVYMPKGFTFNMPPPYLNGWEFVAAMDSATSTKLSSAEAARRLAGRAR